jgi:hypothetical protein
MRAELRNDHPRSIVDPEILAALADDPDLSALFATYPALTREDVKAVFAHAHDTLSHPQPTGSAWLKDLYDYFAPVRTEAERKGYSEEENDATIDGAVAAVRAAHA